jgi:uncharacterized repeat protein (TIGR03803 family)
MCVLSRCVVLGSALLLSVSTAARADFVQTIHTFTGGAADGAAGGTSRLVLATDGFLYGVTEAGGASSGGTFFRLRTDGTDFAVLHSFEAGAQPTWLIQASDGNFYGTQRGGGSAGHGAIFRLTADGTLTVLYNCVAFASGYQPLSILEGRDGNFYGLMAHGGEPIWFDPSGYGLIFALSPSGTYSTFQGFNAATPNFPHGYLIQGSDGNLVGLGSGGVNSNAFSIPIPMNIWTAFDARLVSSALEEGPDGAFYGVGSHDPWGLQNPACGGVARVTFETRSFVHLFDCDADHGNAVAAPSSGGDGFLYGTTANAFYRMTPDGTYTLRAVLPDGPGGPLLKAANGIWYGMTAATIFKVAPVVLTPPPVSFDADAATDMPLYDATTGTWRILTSTSGYRSSMRIFWGGPDYTPVPADYDGDGKLDVAVYHAGRGIWYVLTSSSNFSSVIMKTMGGPGFSPVPGDYDGDGRADFAVMRAGILTVLPAIGSEPRSYTVGTAGDVPMRGDFDGDFVADAAVYRPSTGVWRILTSSSNFTTLVTRTLGGPGWTSVTGDYDGDHKADAAVYNGATGEWRILQSSTNSIVSINWGGTGYAPVPGDYDADGKNDLAVYCAAAGEWYVLLSSTGFTSVLRVIWGTPIDTLVTTMPVRTAFTDALRASDYDGDGASDLAAYDPATGRWSVLTSSSHFTLTGTITWGGGAGDVPVPGDYDGDAITDAAVFNAAAGTWTILRSSLGGLTLSLGSPGDIAVPGDYDGDLVTDAAVFTPSTGVWRLRLSSTGFSAITTVTWGFGAGWMPVPGDYDGDGRTDLGMYVASTATWAVLLSGHSYTTWLFMQWGGPGYTAVPGDHDGDGIVDFAACQTATGQWYVLESGLAYTSAFGVAWSEPINTPLAGDYDGDGIADMASYDATTGEWYLRLSSSDFTLTVERTLGGPGFTLPRTP